MRYYLTGDANPASLASLPEEQSNAGSQAVRGHTHAYVRAQLMLNNGALNQEACVSNRIGWAYDNRCVYGNGESWIRGWDTGNLYALSLRKFDFKPGSGGCQAWSSS